MLTIRLQRTGKKKQADFRIVLAEKTFSVSKKHQEILGTYNPHKKVFKVNEERVKYWISQHVSFSPTVHNLFITNKLMEGQKVRAFNTPKKPSSAEAVESKPVAAETKTDMPTEVSTEPATPPSTTETPTA